MRLVRRQPSDADRALGVQALAGDASACTNPTAPAHPVDSSRPARRRRDRGQIVPLFAMALFLFMGLCAIVIDITWYWTNTLRVQRAADAAALAGAVLLPADPSGAYARAYAEATKNGYTTGVNGVTVTAIQDSENARKLDVTINAPVSTYFMRVVGIQTIAAARTSKAEFVLPVPMGSPQNYYGVGYFVGNVTNTVTGASTNTGYVLTTGADPSCGGFMQPTCPWSNPGNATSVNGSYANSSSSSLAAQGFGGFSISLPSGTGVTDVVEGIQIQTYAKLSSGTGCPFNVDLSWDNGTTWTNKPQSSGSLNTTFAWQTFGSSSNLGAWDTTHTTWASTEVATGTLIARLTPTCTASQVRLDAIQAQVTYHTVTTTTSQQHYNISGPHGETLAPQNFWGAMQSQGAPSIQGDIYMTNYNVRTSTTNTSYDPVNYYNYAVYMPPGTTNGTVWIFDPGFCEVGTGQGVGDSWTIGGTNGYSSAQPVSSFFDLYDDNGTPYTLADDILVASSGNTFKQQTGDDSSLGGSHGSTDCSSTSWHNNWWQLASGLAGGTLGTTYRLHSYSTDPNSSTDQLSTTALDSFAFYADATGGTPEIYGNGAMEAYARIPGGSTTLFYLAQINGVHAGKTVDIKLWDPGDTGTLAATLQIMQPTASGYVPATFSYTAYQGSSSSGVSSCNSSSGTNVTSVMTNNGGTSFFNGCWLDMTVQLSSSYADVTPPGETQPDWWKIQYTMGGSTSSFATDLTTWTVNIRGNPVHLLP